MNKEDLLKALEDKYEKQGQPIESYLKGLLHAKPINYWDYVEVDTLLSLQKPRTDFEDETIFIVYHQITELTLFLILHEVKQITGDIHPSAVFLEEKIERINRYTGLLINSFDIMRTGMRHEDYNEFRYTLTPASGFQSAQFRIIELHCTAIQNLVNAKGKERLPQNPELKDYFENIYWKDAGFNRETGQKSLTLSQFEEKYMDTFMKTAQEMKGKTLEDKVQTLSDSGQLTDTLLAKLKEMDRLFNIEWPMVHLNTARHYLENKGQRTQATGGSEWHKYLMPKYQQRKFFPSIWSEAEIQSWGD